ncbi:hypothetical protein HY995_02875 [Candidatus Micrarchaeota archaeon]|nr:hypothetical protein [Candidatus Micrarchaeota archaeon]
MPYLRAQVSVEYLSLMAVALVIAIIMWGVVSTTASGANDQAAIASSKQAVGKIRDAADLVYTQGAPSQLSIAFVTPRELASVSSSSREISFTLNMSTGQNTYFQDTYADLEGYGLDTLAGNPGTHTLLATAIRRGGTTIVQLNVTG